MIGNGEKESNFKLNHFYMRQLYSFPFFMHSSFLSRKRTSKVGDYRIASHFGILLVLLLTISIAKAQQPGAIDLTFNATDSGFGLGDGVNSQVNATVVQPDGKIIIVGDFSTYNGVSRKGIARLNSDGTLDNSFVPGNGSSSPVRTVALQSDGKILVGGDFTSFGVYGRGYIVRLNADGSVDPAFNSSVGANNAVYTMALQPDGKVIIGGRFTTYNSTSRNGVARLNSDGSLDTNFSVGTGFVSISTATLYASALQSDGKVVVGGEFTNFNGTARCGIARLNANGSLDTSFDPGTGVRSNLSGAIGFSYAISLQTDGKIMIGGSFTHYNNTARRNVTRINSNGTLDTSFDPGTGPNFSVNALVVKSDGKLLIGGKFTFYNGTAWASLALLNSGGTLDTGFNPGTGIGNSTSQTFVINSIVVYSASKYFIGGYFTNYNGNPNKPNFAAINSTGTLDLSFNAGTGCNNEVYKSALQSDGKLLIAGAFTSFNNILRNYLARINSDGTLDTSFDPGSGADFYIYAVALQPDGKIIIGGSFTFYNGTNRNYIARINTDGSLDGSFNPGSGASNSVSVIALQPNGKIIIGGAFTSYNGVARNRIARLNADGSLDTSFNPGTGLDNQITAIALQTDDKIIIGGLFTTFNGTARGRIARLNADGSLDTSFNPGSGADNYIRTIALQSDSKIIVGGDFDAYNGTARSRIARLNTNGSLDTSFNPGSGVSAWAGTAVMTAVVQATGKIVIGGSFTTFNGIARENIARLNTNGSLDAGFLPGTGANYFIRTMELQPNANIIIGGYFTGYNGTGRNRIARIDGGVSTIVEISTGTISPSSICQGASVNVPFTASGTINSGNVFTAQISSATGSFASPVAIGTLAGTASGTISATIPTGTAAGTAYRIRVIGSDPATSGSDNGANLTIKALPNPTASSNSPVCVGNSLNLSATTVTGATYSWTGPNGFTSTLQNPVIGGVAAAAAGTYSVTATANGCAGPARTTTVVVNAAIANNTISSNQAITIGQTPAALTGTTPTGGNGNYFYQWQSSTTSATSGFSNISSATADSYAPGALMQTTWFQRVVTSSPCSNISNAISIQVGAAPTIATSSITGTSFCTATSVNVPFTISGTFNSGNIFTAQLSNASGSFASPVSIGTFTGTTASTISATILPNTAAGTGYRIRIIASDPATTGTDNGANLTVLNQIADPVASASPSTISLGQSTSLSVANPSPNATYIWNGPNVSNQTGTSINVTPATTGSNTYTVTAQANAGYCSAANSSSVTVTVNGALTFAWTGTTSTNWNTASNWSGGTVPTASSDVTISATGGAYPTISSGTATVRNLTIASGANLTISGGTLDVNEDFINNGAFNATGGTTTFSGTAVQVIGGSNPSTFHDLTISSAGASLAGQVSVQRLLTLDGNLNTSGNTFTMLSNATGTAMVVNSGGVVNGTTTVQRYINPSLNSGSGYRHFSSPVSSTTIADLATSGYIPVVNPAYNTPAIPGAVRPFPTVFQYNQARLTNDSAATMGFGFGWESPASLSSVLTRGKGYTVNMPAFKIVDFNGTLNNGTVTVSNLNRGVTTNSGWHLLGNPYPSPIDWDNVTVPSGMMDAVYAFRSTSSYNGSYASYVNGIGTLTDGVIPAMQAFFVRTTGNVSSFSFTNAARLTSYDNPSFYRTTTETRPLLELSAKNAQNQQDAAFVYLQSGATAGVDNTYDAFSLPMGAVRCYTLVGASQLSINGLPYQPAVQLVPLVIEGAAGTYQLKVEQLLNQFQVQLEYHSATHRCYGLFL
jgi:uncharacterized delta-60 repeat protein